MELGQCNADSLRPDLGWLRQRLQQPSPPRMVVLVNPCNPTGKHPTSVESLHVP